MSTLQTICWLHCGFLSSHPNIPQYHRHIQTYVQYIHTFIFLIISRLCPLLEAFYWPPLTAGTAIWGRVVNFWTVIKMCISSEKYGKYVPRSSPAIWWPNLRSVVVGERHGISPEQSGVRDSVLGCLQQVDGKIWKRNSTTRQRKRRNVFLNYIGRQ